MAAYPATRTARKEHKCTVCGEPIKPGQQYIETKIAPGDPDMDNPGWLRYRAHFAEVCYVNLVEGQADR